MITSTQSVREIVAAQSSAAVVLERFDIDLCSHVGESLHQALRGASAFRRSGPRKTHRRRSLRCAACRSRKPVPEPADSTYRPCASQACPSGTAEANCNGRQTRRQAWQPRPRTQKDRGAARRAAGRYVLAYRKGRTDSVSIHRSNGPRPAGSCSPTQACFRSVAQPILRWSASTNPPTDMVAQIRSLARDFDPPAWACATHIAFFSGLRAFEIDLKQHVHLENNVLFPRAIAMEAELSRRG